MKQVGETLQSKFEAFAYHELAFLSVDQLNQSNTCTILVCTYFAGAAEVLGKYLEVDQAECQWLLEQFYVEKLQLDSASSHYLYDMCRRLAMKYSLIKTISFQGGEALSAWLIEPSKPSLRLASYWDEYKSYSFLEAEIEEGLNVPVTMTDQQRIEFNSKFQHLELRRVGRRRYLLWSLIIICIVEVVVAAWYYGLF